MGRLRSRPAGQQPFCREQAPADWRAFFDGRRHIVAEDGSRFCVYEAHASHHTAGAESQPPLFVFHHGAGQSALSFALTVGELRERLQNRCSIVCYDCRGHG